ncbi:MULTISPECIES: pilus assembly FimT family protein [Ramlibacter]|uniref:Prepilin-type N-terminal cleavage/methylation domain-containing protein n=1 Tax=Ramlibacter pinisoli TaxID=2682844 RepID=A0A6N8IWH1_9BURK|nr:MULTISPECIES: prepilin-type N-terminal cleavage/methylation domain-containing protein [Ramlibacter]MBA2965382.1 prepilin-type N-terminal cleavage/methylation domain-containing protein [Ramlibacter sp. CGMCC 1.13660]MVQ30346.1 prepilin-type N-terminal cleavage/methylation domain-containing protein [Ramlibacter pinisoli]
MPTSAPGSSPIGSPLARRRHAGFTLIELLVVVAIIAFASAGVAFALRDSASTQLEREAQRLSALFESARAQSRSSGIPVVWHPVQGGFRFEGLPRGALPERWLSDATVVAGDARVVLGPEPIIARQELVLGSTAVPQRTLRIATDGLRPFTVGNEVAP